MLEASECVCAWCWRLAEVAVVTWKGFSNRAGLSSTVTFVTVTHAILEPHPSTAKAQVRREVCGTKEGTRSVEGGARTRACRNWWGLEIGRAGRAYTRMRARDTHLQAGESGRYVQCALSHEEAGGARD